MFFINDHYRFYELRNKIKNSAYIVANLIQQVSNGRTNKQLTINDLRDISFASCINFFHTNTMFDPFPFGMRYIAHFYWVKRVNENSYQYQKSWACAAADQKTPADMGKTIQDTLTKDKASIIAIHPDLVCSYDGEEKLLIDCVYRKWGTPDKKQLGFLVLTPPLIKSIDGMSDNFFTYSLVIAPKPGIFPAKGLETYNYFADPDKLILGDIFYSDKNNFITKMNNVLNSGKAITKEKVHDIITCYNQEILEEVREELDENLLNQLGHTFQEWKSSYDNEPYMYREQVIFCILIGIELNAFSIDNPVDANAATEYLKELAKATEQVFT